MKDKKFKLEENQGKDYDHILCPYCMETSLTQKNNIKNPDKIKIIKNSICKSDNKQCPYKKRTVPPEKIAKQYGPNPKETKTQKLKKQNIILTILIILSIIITILILIQEQIIQIN